jgi:tetratricopeptide (TPR) repeat protein
VTNVSPTLVNQLYKDSMMGYEPIVVRPVGQALTNLDSLKSPSAAIPIVAPGTAYEAPKTRTGTASMFNVPSTEERKKLLEELSMHGRRDSWVDLRTSSEADIEPLNADARRPATPEEGMEGIPEASEQGVTRGGYLIPPEQRQAPREEPPQPQQAYPGWSGQQESVPKADQDVYFDLLQKMSEVRRAEAAGTDSSAAAQRSSARLALMQESSPQDESLANPNFRASGQTPELPYNRVEMGDSGVVLHSLAGRGEDRFNQFMTEAETQLRAGHYYAAADQYRLAIRTNPSNPLANLGMSIALVGAGEPLGAASHLQKAMQLYPPLMEVRLDLPRMVPTDVIVRQISIVETRLEGQEMGDASLLMVATFIQENLGNSRMARKLAAELKESAGDDLLLNAYADYILSERNQSAEEPTTQLRLPEK